MVHHGTTPLLPIEIAPGRRANPAGHSQANSKLGAEAGVNALLLYSPTSSPRRSLSIWVPCRSLKSGSHKPPYVFPVLGGRNPGQILANIEALDISLGNEQMAFLDNVKQLDLGFPNYLIGGGSTYPAAFDLVYSD